MSFGGDIKPLVQGDLVLKGPFLLQAFVSHHLKKPPKKKKKKKKNKKKKKKKKRKKKKKKH